ncbi:MAG TPA: alkaline phosphatase family protein [Anaerolineaceae bacterium]
MLAALQLFTAAPPVQASSEPPAKTPIQHFIVIMQENHTFDNYFGTYPGADGIPAGTKMPIDPANPAAGSVEPFHIGSYPIEDLSHSATTFSAQWDQGKMDGFVSTLNNLKQDGKLSMGYYNGDDLPFYWNLADQYVLFDRFFSSARDGSFANHMYWVAAQPPKAPDAKQSSGLYDNMVTIFDRLQAQGISWKFYVQNYDRNITYRNLMNAGNRESQIIWVPVLNIDRFIDDPTLNQHIVDLSEYYTDLKNGTLPQVAYITPSGASEHPPGSINTGQRFVKTLIQELMRSQYWSHSAFMLLYDDWGGWYDHVTPPQVDANGYGLRVPGILVSAYARKGYIDHSTYDFSSVVKFIEVNWGVESLGARDEQVNTFLDAFDFSKPARKPVILSATRTPPANPKKVPVQFIYGAYAVALGIAVFFIVLAFIRHFFSSRRDRKPGLSPSQETDI